MEYDLFVKDDNDNSSEGGGANNDSTWKLLDLKTVPMGQQASNHVTG